MVEYKKSNNQIQILDLEIDLKGQVRRGTRVNDHGVLVAVYLRDYMTQVDEDLENILSSDLEELFASVKTQLSCTREQFDTAIFGDGRKKGLAESLWYTRFEGVVPPVSGIPHPFFGDNVRLSQGEVTISGIKCMQKILRQASVVHTTNSGIHVRLKSLISETLGLGTAQWRTYKMSQTSFEAQHP